MFLEQFYTYRNKRKSILYKQGHFFICYLLVGFNNSLQRRPCNPWDQNEGCGGGSWATSGVLPSLALLTTANPYTPVTAEIELGSSWDGRFQAGARARLAGLLSESAQCWLWTFTLCHNAALHTGTRSSHRALFLEDRFLQLERTKSPVTEKSKDNDFCFKKKKMKQMALREGRGDPDPRPSGWQRERGRLLGTGAAQTEELDIQPESLESLETDLAQRFF